MRITKALLVLVVGTFGCKSKIDTALNLPSVENARSLWAQDRGELKERVATLDSTQQDGWADVFEQHLTELFRLAANDPKEAVDEFCSFLVAIAPTPPMRATSTVRLRSLCDDVERTREAKERLARQRSDGVDAVKRAENELKNATAEWKDVQSGDRQVFSYNGMMIAALRDHRYEVMQFEARIVRNSYCAPGEDCSGQMGVGIGSDHDILEATKTRFTSPGEISICVRAKGRESVKINGFDTQAAVYEEVDDPSCGAGQIAVANKRVGAARAAMEKARRELGSQPLEIVASSDHLRATSAVLIFLQCAEKPHGDCLADAAPKVAPTQAAMPGAAVPEQRDSNVGPPSVAGIADPVKGSTDEQALTNPRVEQFLASQVASFRDVGAFVDAFADTAIVFFPGSLMPYEGTTQIANGFREAWGPASAQTEITATPATIGIVGSAALVTTEWRVVYGTTMSFRVRVTEMIESRADSLKIVAAHFSTPPRKGTGSLGEPVPTFPTGSASTSGGILVTSPIDLATMVHDSTWTSAIGSDENEFAIGADASRKMLGAWKKVNLELVGSARIIEGSGYRAVFAFARWRTSKPTLFRVLGIFVRGSSMTMPGPWELASVHYSVALSLDQ